MIQEFIDSVLLPASGTLFLAVLVFVVGQVVLRVLLRLIEKLLQKANLDGIFITFARRVSNILLQLLLISLVLIVMGVNPVYLFALVGVLGLALTLAFQESLQNFAGAFSCLRLLRSMQVMNLSSRTIRPMFER